MILVIDFGSQYTNHIAKRLNIVGIETDVIPASTKLFDLRRYKGVILSGGPDHIPSGKFAQLPQQFWQKVDVPVLGICYGAQLMAWEYGAKIEEIRAEFGHTIESKSRHSRINDNLPKNHIVWMSHTDSITEMPVEWEVTGFSENGNISSFVHQNLPFYGVLYHPEVKDSKQGETLLKNFAVKVCGLEPNLGLVNKAETLIQNIRDQVGDDRVLLGISGGVDSAVAAVLLNKAIGNQLHCVFVDHGFHREGEPEELVEQFKMLGLEVQHVMARKSFLNKLIGITDAEKKRKIIGHHFIDVFNTVIEAAQNEAEFVDEKPFKFLAQGTIASDVIESENIKSHHNTVIPDTFGLEILEPLRELFKDDVRELGKYLGMPTHIIWRQPVPGPGLAIRVVGEVTKEKLRIVRKADLIVREEIEAALQSQHLNLWQYFAALLDIKVTGVKGDNRSYEYPIVLRMVRSTDGMTATAALDISPLTLRTIVARITREVKGVNRVFLDITDKPSACIELE